MLNARVDALDPVDQLQLIEETVACKAVLDWTHCRVASGLALKDLSSPIVRQAVQRSGGCCLIQVAGCDTPLISEGIITELALALSCSERSARDYIAVGLDLRYRLRCTNNEFGGGRITFAHAKVISEATRSLSIDLCERLDERLSDEAPSRTPARLRILARRLVAKADPDGLAKRHELAMSERSASIFPLGDGVAAFSFDHQLEVAAVIDDQLTTWARRRRAADPHTPFAAHRADAAALLLLGRHPLTGTDLLSPGSELYAASSPCPTFPPIDTAGLPAALPPIDTAGLPAALPPIDTAGLPAALPPAAAPALPAGLSPARPSDVLPVRTEIRVTMGADTLLGLDNETCELDGFGPLTADQARRLALRSSSTVLRRLFTDPIDDTVMTMDARTYRFSARQVEAVRSLHPISCFPGATTPADRCDIDHREPYRFGPPGTADPPGQTVVGGGQPLDRRHHRYRTHLDWIPTVDPTDPHTIYWTSPYGRTYTVRDHDGA